MGTAAQRGGVTGLAAIRPVLAALRHPLGFQTAIALLAAGGSREPAPRSSADWNRLADRISPLIDVLAPITSNPGLASEAACDAYSHLTDAYIACRNAASDLEEASPPRPRLRLVQGGAAGRGC